MTHSIITATARLRWLVITAGRQQPLPPRMEQLQQLYQVVTDGKMTEEWRDVETVREP